MKKFAAALFIAAITNLPSFAQESPSVQLFAEQQESLDVDPKNTREKSDEQRIQIDAALLQVTVNVEIAARDAGVIESISVVEGAQVAEGDVLLVLDRENAKARAKAARNELEIAKEESENDVDLKYAKVSEEVSCQVYKRSVEAVKQYAKSVSKTELERLKLEFERARLSGEQAERTAVVNELTVELKKAQLELAAVELDNREIKAPVSGMIVQVYRQVGEWVQPGQPIARVIDLKKLRVSCRCYLKNASPDSIASEATFIRNGEEFNARVVFASPEIDPDVQDFIVWAEVENPKGTLKPGMSGSVVLTTRD